MRPARIIATVAFAATVGLLTLGATPAWAAPTTPPVAVHVSPSPVVAGHAVTMSGSVGPDAAGSDCSSIILYSTAFAPTNDSGDMTAVSATAKPSGAFSATTTITRSKLAGTYPIHLRCGGATIGGGRLVVQAAPAALHVSPQSVTAGDTVTVSGWLPPAPGSECASGVTLLSNAFVHTHDFADVPAIAAAVKPDGTFSVTTRIPRSKAAGTYDISGRCGGGNIGASATLRVRAAPPATTTPAPAPPAPPVTQPQAPTPTLVGPALAGPATPAAAQPAGRWILPWLAALGSSTLAGLGMWLLYRRRHPSSLAR